MSSFVLRPTGLGAQNLKVLTIVPGEPFIIGRNANTFQDEKCTKCVHVSRKLAILEIDDENELNITPCAKGATTLYINDVLCAPPPPGSDPSAGKHPLDPGDVISLLGSESCFNFAITKPNNKRARLSNSSSTNSISEMGTSSSGAGLVADSSSSSSTALDVTVVATTPAKSTPASAPASAPVSAVQSPGAIAAAALAANHEERERALECTICMDMIACAHNISNCECARPYCYMCISSVTQCPSCRKNFTPLTHLMPNRFVDETARSLLKEVDAASSRAVTVGGRLEEWEKRCEDGLKVKRTLQGKATGGSGKGKMSAAAQAQQAMLAWSQVRQQQEAVNAAMQARLAAVVSGAGRAIASAQGRAQHLYAPAVARNGGGSSSSSGSSGSSSRGGAPVVISLDDAVPARDGAGASASGSSSRTAPRMPRTSVSTASSAQSELIDLT